MNSNTNNPMGWLALDIGSKTHCWASRIDDQRESGCVDNEPAALRRFLQNCLSKTGTLRVLVEATGIYYLEVTLIAHELGAEVMVINPRMAHHFAKAIGQRNKTDPLDADLLLECLMRMPFAAWEPPRKAWRELRSFGRFLVQLTEEGAADRNRLHALTKTPDSPISLHTELKRKIASNDKRIARIRAQAVALIKADDYLNERFEAMVTVPGIAEIAAVSVLSELVTLPPTLSGRACVCHAGLHVRVFESGSSVHKAPRISRHGNRYLRRALFHPALIAGVHDPRTRAFKARLVGRGKKKMQANVAIMRKMLTAVWAIMKHPEPYDATRLYANLENA